MEQGGVGGVKGVGEVRRVEGGKWLKEMRGVEKG